MNQKKMPTNEKGSIVVVTNLSRPTSGIPVPPSPPRPPSDAQSWHIVAACFLITYRLFSFSRLPRFSHVFFSHKRPSHLIFLSLASFPLCTLCLRSFFGKPSRCFIAFQVCRSTYCFRFLRTKTLLSVNWYSFHGPHSFQPRAPIPPQSCFKDMPFLLWYFRSRSFTYELLPLFKIDIVLFLVC